MRVKNITEGEKNTEDVPYTSCPHICVGFQLSVCPTRMVHWLDDVDVDECTLIPIIQSP